MAARLPATRTPPTHATTSTLIFSTTTHWIRLHISYRPLPSIDMAQTRGQLAAQKTARASVSKETGTCCGTRGAVFLLTVSKETLAPAPDPTGDARP